MGAVRLQKIYFINLDKDSERRNLLESRLRRHYPEIPYERFSALSADSFDRYLPFFQHRLRDNMQPVNGVYPRPGTLGCFLSHYQLLKQIDANWRENGPQDACYLVLEDDCVFDESVLPKISHWIDESIPSDWSVVTHPKGRIYWRDRANKYFHHIHSARHRKWIYYWGAHFCIYRGCAIGKIVELMEQEEIYDVDKWLRNNVSGAYSFRQHLRIKTSNLGGSNTNPRFAGPENQDATSIFRRPRPIRDFLRQFKRY